jgi:beta-galactosidase/beta-glucuronidase
LTFGLREIGAKGKEFILNGHAAFFRGTLECCIFPLTGYPPTDVPSWKRIIGTCKAHGLNLIRFHSWCPPEAAFIAADELGFYFQVECAV